jgi:hypothetical protein
LYSLLLIQKKNLVFSISASSLAPKLLHFATKAPLCI